MRRVTDRAAAGVHRLVVLCDAAATTGLGHFVRSASLAATLAARGADVHALLPADTLDSALARARSSGWRLEPRSRWDADSVLRVAGAPGSVVLLDSYRVRGSWIGDLHRRLSAAGVALAVVDDLADRRFPADVVVNQNVGAERLSYPDAARVLAGPSYALLRPPFAAHREAALASLPSLPERPRRVLCLFGGTDAGGMAAVAAAAAAAAFPAADVRAVVPGGHRGGPPPGPRVTVLPHVDAVHEEMLAADLVVTAGGTTLWELCCLARPAAVVAVAGNQLATFEEMTARAAILPLARRPVRDVASLARRLAEVTAPAGTLRRVAEAAARITDGRGCERTADALAGAGTAVGGQGS